MSLISTVLASVAVALGWGLVLAAAGARARALARLDVAPDLRFAFDFLAGCWVASVVLLACGLAGAFHPGVLLAVTVLLAVAGRWRGLGAELRATAPFFAPAVVFLPAALQPASPFYDALNCHFAFPWQALIEGRFSAHPENFFAQFPPLVQLVFAPALAVGLDRVPALLHLLAFAAAASAVASLARALGAHPVRARLAGAALVLLPSIVLLPGLPAAEGWLIAAVVTAAAHAIGLPAARRRGLAVGFLLGCAVAARLQGVLWTGLVGLVLVLTGVPGRGPGAREAAAALAGVVCGSAPWWVKNLALLGEPFAPIGWQREGLETLWRDGASRMYSVHGAGPLLASFAADLRPLLLYPCVLPLLALAALLACGARGAWRARLVGATALLGAAAWEATGALPRFLAPALALVLALAAASGTSAADGLARVRRSVVSATLVWSLVIGLLFNLEEMDRFGMVGLGRLLPVVDRILDLEPEHGPPGGRVNDPIPAFVAARVLPAGARVLFVAEARSYPFPRLHVVPSQHDVSPLREPLEQARSPAEARAWLAGAGYTHLLVNFGELERLGKAYPVAPWRSDAGRERFRQLVALLGPPVVAAETTAVFAVRP